MEHRLPIDPNLEPGAAIIATFDADFGEDRRVGRGGWHGSGDAGGTSRAKHRLGWVGGNLSAGIDNTSLWVKVGGHKKVIKTPLSPKVGRLPSRIT